MFCLRERNLDADRIGWATTCGMYDVTSCLQFGLSAGDEREERALGCTLLCQGQANATGATCYDDMFSLERCHMEALPRLIRHVPNVAITMATAHSS